MGRSPCAAEGGLIYRALNGANARLTIFADEDDYAAFDRALAGSVARHDVWLVAYKVLPNHFHLILWPGVNGDLSRVHEVADVDAHPTLAATAIRWARVPRPTPLQVLPGPGTTATSSRAGGAWSATPCGLVW
jgi:hypothetical protein